MIGQTISHYRILEKLGEGGMGVVYKAEDTVLGRAVAIKFLPESLATDAEYIARFEREAKLLASLNPPNIAAIHGLEKADAQRFLVLELVEGESLAERWGRGRVPVDEALNVCLQIAAGMEAAHEQGVIHRDLKPSNVKLTSDGKVKVLEFGLAKAWEAQSSGVDLSQSPTTPVNETLAGLILGTAAYMSPEQARGKPLDKRTDIWSFGCILFEALTGSKAFGGETISDSIATVLQSEPAWGRLPAGTPAAVRRLLARCLQKDPARRLRDIGDARIVLEELQDDQFGRQAEKSQAARQGVRSKWGTWAAAFVAVLATAIALWFWSQMYSAPVERSPVVRITIDLPPGQRLGMDFPPIALSPDGSQLVYVAHGENQSQLYLRSLNQFESRPLAGTEGGADPFFSPDGQWVGFFADGKLKRVLLAGGTPLTVCDAAFIGPGATWGPDDTIIFPLRESSGLCRVSAAGGKPEVLTKPDKAGGEIAHRRPRFLPDGKSALFTVQAAEGPRIAILSVETGQWQTLLTGSTMALYLPPEYLVFFQSSDIRVVPLDPDRLELTGTPIPVLDGVYSRSVYGVRVGWFALSRTGSLAYVASPAQTAGNRVAWFDMGGRKSPR